jgi:hypothetical protein
MYAPHDDVAATDSYTRSLPEPLTERSLALRATLLGEATSVETLAARFPHVLNRVSAAWDTPTATFELIGELFVDRRGGRAGFPADALYELLALRRLCIRRIVATVGL